MNTILFLEIAELPSLEFSKKLVEKNYSTEKLNSILKELKTMKEGYQDLVNKSVKNKEKCIDEIEKEFSENLEFLKKERAKSLYSYYESHDNSEFEEYCKNAAEAHGGLE